MVAVHGQVRVSRVVALKCDRCGREAETGDVEFGEFWSFDSSGGYASIFGDCNGIKLDLCQYCARATLGPWVQVVGDGLPDIGPKPKVTWHEHVFANTDHLARTDEEERLDRLDVVGDDAGSIYVFDPVTKVKFAWFAKKSDAVEFAKKLVVMIRSEHGRVAESGLTQPVASG